MFPFSLLGSLSYYEISVFIYNGEGSYELSVFIFIGDIQDSWWQHWGTYKVKDIFKYCYSINIGVKLVNISFVLARNSFHLFTCNVALWPGFKPKI